MIKIIELIYSDEATKGCDDSPYVLPIRNVVQLWTRGGKMVAEYDPCGDGEEKGSSKMYFEPRDLWA